MIKIFIPKFLYLVILLVALLFSTSLANAANEFSSSYDINYSVLEDGTTEVTEDITLKNLTDKFFPSSFSLVYPSSEVSDIKASDSQGQLQVQTSQENTGTKLIVKFTNQQIIGIGKEYKFNLKFNDKGIAKRLGKVWSIKIPKITQQSQVEEFYLSLTVPTSFGDPDYILPVPASVDESGGRINFIFNGDSLFQSGISAVFGQSINYSFKAGFTLKNNSLFPEFLKIPLGINSPNQKTFIESIDPRPENSEIDNLGNTLAYFRLNPGEQKKVIVKGLITTILKSPNKQVLNDAQVEAYLRENKYWGKNNPVTEGKLTEILDGKESFPPLQKAKEIDKFVSNFLKFDYSRIEKGDFVRLGSLTAINNPEKALSAEFSDLEIALLRSAGIPARQVLGFSLPQNGKPFSYQNKSLHSWVEFYDSQLGWVVADPAWENTTAGSVLFNFNDLNHLSLALSSGDDNFVLPETIKTEIFEGEVQEKKGAELDIKVSTEILSGFPSQAKIKINNLGNTAFPESELKIDTSKILIQSKEGEPSVTMLAQTPQIPPFGHIEYNLSLKTGAIWQSYQDAFQVNFAGVTDTRIITVKPILSYKIFTIEIFGALTMIALFYILTILIHFRSAKKP